MRRSHLVLVGLLAFARMSLSILVYQNPEPAYFPDSAGYERLGKSLLDGTAYRSTRVEEAELFRPPGYPAFITLPYGLLGRNAGNLVLLQLGLGGPIIFLLYQLGLRLHSPPAGLVAAALYAFDPLSALWGLAVLSDTLFTALVVVGLYGLVRWQLERRAGWLVLAGLAGGVSALVRPVGLLLLPLWALIVFLTGRGLQQSKRSPASQVAVKGLLVFGGAFLLIVMPWSVRNKLVWDVFGISSVAARNGGLTEIYLEEYLAPATIAERDGVSLEAARESLIPPTGLSRASRTAWFTRVIWSNPQHYAKAHLKGTLQSIVGIEYIDWFEFFGRPAERPGLLVALQAGDPGDIARRLAGSLADQPAVAAALILSLLYQLLLYLAALLGFRSLYRRQPWTLALLVATGAILILVPGVVGESRFRVPVQPILALMAGLGLVPTESRL